MYTMDGVCIFLHHLIQTVNDHNPFISAGSTTHPGLPDRKWRVDLERTCNSGGITSELTCASRWVAGRGQAGFISTLNPL